MENGFLETLRRSQKGGLNPAEGLGVRILQRQALRMGSRPGSTGRWKLGFVEQGPEVKSKGRSRRGTGHELRVFSLGPRKDPSEVGRRLGVRSHV